MESAEKLVALLKEKGLKITTAESCTGGLLSAAITSVPGSSAVFDGGLCSYANRIKSGMLGVSKELLETEGAVSQSCALQMALGAMNLFGAQVAVSVTGIAGPDGGTAEKPVGIVYICVLTITGGKTIKLCHFTGDRDAIRQKTVETALQTAISLIE